jgi:formiminoglutamase
MLSNWISPWDFQEEIDAAIIGAPMGPIGQAGAPNVFREQLRSLATRNAAYDSDPAPLKVRDVGNVVMHPTDIFQCHDNVEKALIDLYTINQKFVPIIVGGDHSVAAPSFRAFKAVRGETVGLIDFDAHPDTRDDSTNGPTSGTPFRQLLEGGHLDGNNAVQIGFHGFLGSSELYEYNRGHGITLIPAAEVRRRRMADVIKQALEKASDGTDSIYISLDIDVMDAPWGPGTGGDAPGGLDAHEMLEAMYLLGRHPKVWRTKKKKGKKKG